MLILMQQTTYALKYLLKLLIQVTLDLCSIGTDVVICYFCMQACLLLSKISPKVVGESLKIGRQYDAINCLMSFMVSIMQTYAIILYQL